MTKKTETKKVETKTAEQKKVIDLKIFDALNILRKTRPHIFALLDIVNIEADAAEVPTALVCWDKTQKKFQVKIGREFSDKLDSQNFSAVLEHELLHVLFEHLFDETMPDKKIANIAMDSIINDSIDIFKKDKACELLNSRVKLREINPQFDISKNTSLDVYKYLMANAKKIPKINFSSDLGEGESSPNNNGEQNIDSHDGFANNNDSINGENNSALADQLDKDMAKAALKNQIEKNLDKFIGTNCAEINRVVAEMTKVEYNFKSLFSNAVKKTLRGDTKKTWKKLSRRLPDIIKGKAKTNIPKVLLVVDTSGSIDDETISKVNWQIHFLSQHYDFTVIWGDTELEGQVKIKKGQKHKINFSGGGGTDLNFYYDIHKKENFDLIIFDTDGYIPPMPLECHAKKIFCIYGNGREVNGQKNIVLK